MIDNITIIKNLKYIFKNIIFNIVSEEKFKPHLFESILCQIDSLKLNTESLKSQKGLIIDNIKSFKEECDININIWDEMYDYICNNDKKVFIKSSVKSLDLILRKVMRIWNSIMAIEYGLTRI